MSKVAVVASYAPSLVRFRGHLLRTLVDMGHTVYAFAPDIDGKVESWLRDAGIIARRFFLQRTGMNFVADMRSISELRRLFLSVQPDVVLGYSVKPVVYGSWAAKLAGVRRICSLISGLGYAFSGDSWKHKALRAVVRRLYKEALRWNDVVMFQNPDDMELFRQGRIVPDSARIVVVRGSGVDLDHFRPTPLPQTGMTFLMISRLLKEKGVEEYAEAARIIRSRYPEARFLLVGPMDSNPGGISPTDLQRWTAGGFVEYVGEVDDVRPYIRQSTVYVLPSYREGTPRSVLEAMAMGRPIVTTDVPGCRQTVEDGLNGFLVPPRDPTALANALERFIVDSRLASRMGQASRRMAEERFDVRQVTAAMLDAMELLVQPRGR
ncbi:glycosyltransferase family 4 protein [Geochorda subterranea]|uniref:Glycosyltransferase family 4 protein n=1 Tax=Geochorda subterranea TaxID=3109564 RepID=A0ABZ1BMD2_9FIRM|nr:glycosyltransferase family 4 protein [Limnochorda sp. LNt]WRP13725.1 glycosyltransferase family 4 protein [Limnochorda sp. LNt]